MFLLQNERIKSQKGLLMPKTKRLFLFAGFDRDNVIDDTLIYYVNALSKLGDIVFVMDNDIEDTEIKKISKIPNVLHASAARHGEYDFGSYKRAFAWAHDKKILNKYDWVYFVNDSVFGPFNDLEPILTKQEKSGADMIGMSSNYDGYTPLHIQSWFIGFDKKIFTSEFFENFIRSITHIPNKMHLVLKYEVALTNIVLRHGFKMNVILDAHNTDMYDDPRPVLVAGVPFIKKSAISRVCDLCFIYPHMDDEVLLKHVIAYMKRYDIKLDKDSYRDVYMLKLFGVPILRITSKDSKYYKIYLFGCVPVLKIIKNA